MKKLVPLLLSVALLVAISTTALASGTVVKDIEFSLDGWCVIDDPVTGEESEMPVSAVLSGKIKDKNGTLYVSPLTGKLTGEGMEHNILVKMAKQSEPIYHASWEDGTPGEWYYKVEVWRILGESNVQGTKLIAYIEWVYRYIDDGGDISEEGWTFFNAAGVVDGKWVDCWLEGEFPVIE